MNSVRSIVKRLRESAEEEVWDKIHPIISDALMKVTGSGLDDASYDYNNGSFRGQGVVYFEDKKESNKKWKLLNQEIRKALSSIGYEEYQMYDYEEEGVPAGAPFTAFRIYIRASKQEDLDESTPPGGKGWQHWDMPKDYKGPWTQDYFYKEYGNDILGFIYPPYEANIEFLKDMTHYDYVAFLYDNKAASDIDSQSFPKMKDAREWVEKMAAYTLDKKE